MKMILFLFLPFLWQCGDALSNFFEPADLGDGFISRELTEKLYSIHSDFEVGYLDSNGIVDISYESPTIAYLTEEGYVFYGLIVTSRDSPKEKDIYILFEIRKDKDSINGIKVNSAHTTRKDRTPLDLYNARTELPTTVVEKSGTVPGKMIVLIGIWPKYSKLTHENLLTTNTSAFNYINALQSKLYTNIVPEEYSLNTGGMGIGSEIDSSESIKNLKAIVSGKVWNSVRYPPSLTPIFGATTNYYFFLDGTLHVAPTAITPTATPYYGWDIWTFDGIDKEGSLTEHYLYTYRALTMALKKISRTTPAKPGEENEKHLLRLVLTDNMPLTKPISPNDVYGNLLRLSIAP